MALHDLLIRGARVIDPAQDIDRIDDVAVSGGKIVGIGDYSSADASRVIDAAGCVVSPGWIDMHVHVFAGAKASGVDADRDAGIHTGVTTVVDAGTAGIGSWPTFRDAVIERATTRVLGYMNVSMFPTYAPKHGEWDNFSQGKTIQMTEREAEAGYCVGVKVLASQTHCGNLGIIPVELARQAARLSGTGLMVHIGNAPPVIEDVLELLGEGDVVTHCWHGKYGGLFGRDKKPLPETLAAVERGVKFDIGHGSASFSFDTARYALDAGLPLHAISTDIHGRNVRGPVFDQGTTMAKFLHLGFDLPEVIRLSTASPAQLIGRAHELGSLEDGREADITIFNVVGGEFDLTDSEGKTERGDRQLAVQYTIRSGAVVKEPNNQA